MMSLRAKQPDAPGFVTELQGGWFALLASSVIFGVSHGAMWLPGIGAGLGFGLLAVRTGKIGEAVAAHAVANAGIAAYVLCFDQWQLR